VQNFTAVPPPQDDGKLTNPVSLGNTIIMLVLADVYMSVCDCIFAQFVLGKCACCIDIEILLLAPYVTY